MTRLHHRLIVGAWCTAALLLLLFLTLVFIPDRELQGVITRMLEQHGYSFSATEFGKTLPLGLNARNVTIGNENGPLVKADKASIRLRLLPLLIGRVQLTFAARIGAGLVSGEYSPTGGGSAALEVKRLQLEDIPFFKTAADATVKGDLVIHAKIREMHKKATGEVQLEVRGADLRGIKIGETPLPDAGYHTVRGMLRLNGGRANLESFTLQGDDVFVRLKGGLTLGASPAATPVNLTLELMPKPQFLEKQKFVFLLLSKYITSPGSYQIPIKGTLAKPSI